MATINFNAIDEDKNTSPNSVGTINFDAISQENKDAIQYVIDNPVDVAPPAESQNLRSYAQGALLGFADELEAGLMQLKPGSRPYEEIRDEIRQKLHAFQKENPKIAITQEILGALAPTALAFLVPGGQGFASARTGNILQRAWPSVKWGIGEGGTAALGTGEQGLADDLTRVPLGMGVGGVFAGTTGVVMDAGGGLISKAIEKLRAVFGDETATVVGKKFMELVQSTGLSPEEVIEKVANGEIVADNKTLEGAMRWLRGEMADKGQIDSTLARRTTQTRDIAKEKMQKEMTPDIGDRENVHKAYTATDEAFKKQERKLYKHVWKDAKELTPEIVETLTEALNRLPDAGETLNKIYKARGNVVPFFVLDKDGIMKIERMPTLEDAEIIRRALYEDTSTAFRSGKGTLGEPLGDLEKRLKGQLDIFSPSLSATRANASVIRKARDAYKLGRGSLSKNTDELEVEMEALIGVSPTIQNNAVLKAFRSGIMNALRNKIRKTPTYLNKVAKEGSQENELIRLVFPEQSVNDIIKKARIAGQSQQAENRITMGSGTAPQQQAGNVVGNVVRATQGDPQAMVALTGVLVDSLKQGLSPQQKQALVQLLLSENPDAVRKALTSGNMKIVQDMINKFTGGISRASSRAVAYQTGKAGGDVELGITGLLSSMTNSGNDENNGITLWK